MSCKLYIDTRESKLIDCLTSESEYITKQLEIGDIIIESSQPEFKIIFERKTYQDLLSSINDGRYKEQKMRLLASNPPHHCVYIIEGEKIINESISGAIYHSMFRDKIHVLFTDTVKATAELIMTIYNKCAKNPEKFVATNENADYIANLKVKKCKIENINKENCFILQLCQIPSISHTIAREIASRYKNWKELITVIENNPNILTTIPMIGEKKAKNIIDYLL